MGGPCVEVVSGADSAIGALVLAYGPVLVEGRGARDMARALGLIDIVSGTVRSDGTLVHGACGRLRHAC